MTEDTCTMALLRELKISLGTGTEEAILPMLWVGREDFEALENVAQIGAQYRTLSVGIGEGVTYKIGSTDKHGCNIEVVFHSQSAGFMFPLNVRVMTSHEPSEPSEHSEWCPYSWSEWPKDENGEGYWAEPELMIYDEESDTWSAPEEHRLYDVDCNCEYVDDEAKEFVINDDADIAPITEYIAEHWR